jgi:hypothetical protein
MPGSGKRKGGGIQRFGDSHSEGEKTGAPEQRPRRRAGALAGKIRIIEDGSDEGPLPDGGVADDLLGGSVVPASTDRIPEFDHSVLRNPELRRVAITAYRRLAKYWFLDNAEAAALLGVSPGTWQRIKDDRWTGSFNQDQLTRLSLLVGMFEALHTIFANDMADRWPRLPNKNELFEGKSPIAMMVEDGIPAMLIVLAHVRAIQQGY